MRGSVRVPLVGRTFGAWHVLADDAPPAKNGEHRKARCQCACGHIQEVNVQSLKRGESRSCRRCGARRLAAEQQAAGRMRPRVNGRFVRRAA